MFGKRGELTSSQIIGIVIVLAGFVVLLLFLPAITSIFGEGGDSDRELCKLSVIARATAPNAIQAGVPLRCTTEKVCLSESGKKNECKQFAGEENIRGVKLNIKDPEKAAEVIEKEVADSMFFCWQTMGEGKLDLWNRRTSLGDVAPMCVVCSRVAIDENLFNDKDKNFTDKVMNLVDVNDYMANKRPSDSVPFTYLQFFTDIGVGVPSREVSTEGNGEPSDQLAVVFGQVKVGKLSDAALSTAGTGVALYVGSLLTPAGRITANPYVAAGSAITILTATGISVYKTHKGQVLAGAYCGDFTSSDEKARKGCSVVRAIEWDAGKINGFCSGGIQGDL